MNRRCRNSRYCYFGVACHGDIRMTQIWSTRFFHLVNSNFNARKSNNWSGRSHRSTSGNIWLHVYCFSFINSESLKSPKRLCAVNYHHYKEETTNWQIAFCKFSTTTLCTSTDILPQAAQEFLISKEATQITTQHNNPSDHPSNTPSSHSFSLQFE